MGTVEPGTMAAAVDASPLQPRYGTAVDRESAREMLAARLAPPARAPVPEVAPRPEPAPRRRSRAAAPEEERGVLGDLVASSAFRSFARSAASTLGRELTRGLFGTRRRR
jgi:DNA double-strand break repair helicase HerA and related ATPase